jgi:hypothetical protein
MGSVESVGSVPKEYHAQDRHEVIARRELRVGAEVVRGFPEIVFQLLDVFEGVGHSCGSDTGVILPTQTAEDALQGSSVQHRIDERTSETADRAQHPESFQDAPDLDS